MTIYKYKFFFNNSTLITEVKMENSDSCLIDCIDDNNNIIIIKDNKKTFISRLNVCVVEKSEVTE